MCFSFKPHRHWPVVRKARSRKLLDGCEAFLAGRYLSLHLQTNDWAPPWAWLNTLAHGDRADIEALASAPDEHLGTGGRAQYLAAALLAACDNHHLDLRYVQRGFLVPLELRYGSFFAIKAIVDSVLAELERAEHFGGGDMPGGSREPHGRGGP
jgi:hypothetical protein